MPLTQITPDVVTSNVLVNAAISYFSSNTANAIVNGSTIIPYTLAANTIANNVIGTAQLANNLSISGNTNFNNVPSTTTPTNIGVVQVGSILNFTDVNIQMGVAQSVNNYTQIILQNSNTGTLASADFIVNNDSPAGTTIYGDFGINSTVFSGSGAFSDANGTYAYASGGTMTVGTYGANNLKFATNNTTALTIDTNGNLGLGVTPNAWSGFNQVMQMNHVSFGSAGANEMDLGVNFYYNSGYKYMTTGYATDYIQYSGQHQWYTAPSNTAGSPIAFTQAMTLDNYGNLLINSTSAYYSGKMGIQLNPAVGQANTFVPVFINGIVCSTAGNPSFVGNWYSPGWFGIGPDTQNADNTVRIGQVNGNSSGFSWNGTYSNIKAAGIIFNNASSSVNSTLNDYETGTWTPIMSRSSSNPSVSYVFQVGTYTKTGNMVYATGAVDWSSVSGGSGFYQISGLPFTVLNSSHMYPQGTANDFSSGFIPSGYTQMGMEIDPGTTTAQFIVAGYNQNSANISSIPNSGVVYFTLVYIASF